MRRSPWQLALTSTLSMLALSCSGEGQEALECEQPGLIVEMAWDDQRCAVEMTFDVLMTGSSGIAQWTIMSGRPEFYLSWPTGSPLEPQEINLSVMASGVQGTSGTGMLTTAVDPEACERVVVTGICSP